MRKLSILFITAVLLFGLAAQGFAAGADELGEMADNTASFVLDAVRNPQVGMIGGEWAVMGLARSGCDVPDSYFENYYRTVERYVRDLDGVLHERKYTEYSRVILALTAAGYDPRDVAGYDLTVSLGDFEKTIFQGINGPIYALLALDCLGYDVPVNGDAARQATRELYVEEILRRQLNDGGWRLAAANSDPSDLEERADPDITGIALQALAKYRNEAEVSAAIERGLECLSGLQNDNGGFTCWGSENVESTAQVVVALCELGIPIDDRRFVKNGITLIDNIICYKNSNGSFNHDYEGGRYSLMSTEQAFYGIVAALRAEQGLNSLFNMSDAPRRGAIESEPTVGLPNMHEDVMRIPVSSPGRTFDDVEGHLNRPAIEALAARGIINGNSATIFAPDDSMTRAEFAAIIVSGLGLLDNGKWEVENRAFSDIAEQDWYCNAVYCAYSYEIVSGKSPVTFDPEGILTRQEAATLIANTARLLCGIETGRTDTEIRNTLSMFGDYMTVAEWAREAMAFCYDSNILDGAEFDIGPDVGIQRGEVAEMLYRLLGLANLL